MNFLNSVVDIAFDIAESQKKIYVAELNWVLFDGVGWGGVGCIFDFFHLFLI